MSILFLDIDGVLNSQPFLADSRVSYGSEIWPDAHIDPVCVSRLNRILAATGASVVLSSSWRMLISLEEMNAVLRRRGYIGPDIQSYTPKAGPHWVERSCEIWLWLKANKVPDEESYCVLDDSYDAKIVGKFVHTSAETGLTEVDADKAIEILGRIVL